MSNSQTTTLKYDSPVGVWVAQHPQTADVFEVLRIDYCCDGDKPLEWACWENGLDLLRVHSLLRCIIAEIDDATMGDWLHAPLADLCDHIEYTHHAFLKNSLPSLSSLLAKVVELHGYEHEELRDVQHHFATWRDAILAVIAEEERSLFPAIRLMESHEEPTDRNLGSIPKLIRRVAFEHKDIGVALKEARKASGDFIKPKDACPTFAQMYGLLRRVETDVRHHVHKEEYILFPRAVELADRIKGVIDI